MEIQVIGGGALGMSAAVALAEDGHDVRLVEKSQLGAESTGKAAGISSTMTWNDDDYQLIAETRGKIGELISLAAGPVPESRKAWRSADSITIAKGEKISVLDDMQHRLERFTEEPERLDHRQAAELFSTLNFEPGEEILVAQEDGCIEAGEFLAAMRWRLETEGVEVHEATAGIIEGPTVVAGGAWTKGLLEQNGTKLPVQCFRTQLANIGLRDASEVPIVHDAVHGFYARPESDSTFMAGDGTRLHPHDPEQYNEAGGKEFENSLARAIPRRFKKGGNAVIRRSWAGLCVATPDRRPLCGPVPGQENLWGLTGDNGYGLMRSLALGERLAASIDGQTNSATDPARFDGFTDDWQMKEGFGF